MDQAAIAADVPEPLRDSIDWKDDDLQLMVASDQMAHVHISEAYVADDGDEPEEFDEDSRFYFSADSQVRRFNDDIERWLNATHAVCSILVAYRAEGGESGRSELSRWHRPSPKSCVPLVSELMRLGTDEDHPAAHMARGILDMLKEASSWQSTRSDPVFDTVLWPLSGYAIG